MDKPDNYPKIVYKYRNWKDKYHKDVLLKNHLFLSSPKEFNDPFDCRIPINYKLLDTKEKIKKFVDQAMIRHYKWIVTNGMNIEHEMKRIEYQLTNEMDKFQANHEQISFDINDKYYGVLSLSRRWDSILMWSHYADFHKGYCVGFWEEKLRNSDLFGRGGGISYNTNNNYPQIDPFDDNAIQKAFDETHTKASDWEYEKEYRITKLFDFELTPPTIADRTVKIPNDFFAEIIIGLNTHDNDRDEIIEVGRHLGIKVFQVIKVPFKFLIDREEIKNK